MHSTVMTPFVAFMLSSGDDGYIMTHEVQITLWMHVPVTIMELGTEDPTHFLRELFGLVALKAMTTVIVLAKIQDTQRENIVPKIACRMRQVMMEGRPRNKKEQRKHRSRATSRR